MVSPEGAHERSGAVSEDIAGRLRASKNASHAALRPLLTPLARREASEDCSRAVLADHGNAASVWIDCDRAGIEDRRPSFPESPVRGRAARILATKLGTNRRRERIGF